MPLSRRASVNALFLVFVASGVAGLIYQSIWSHYLGLTLGHAAYAQTLVLAMFMGGMAVGAWWAGKRSRRWQNLVMAYAVIEAVIGLFGLLFHPLFVGYTDLSQLQVLPALDSEWLARAYQWSTAALLIAPQTVLLGATFPILSAAILRLQPSQDGETLGGLYFTNSIGAAAGALISTFLLLPLMGMPGTIVTGGLLSLAVAGVSFVVARTPLAQGSAVAEHGAAGTAAVPRRLQLVLLSAAGITGATSFFYEVSWVRMLNMALGTTVHSFELMLAAFIAGLAFGGYWIKRRSHAITDPVRYAGYAQVFMGIAALLSLLVFANAFQGVSWLMSALAPTGPGYTLFSIGGAVVSLLVMFPAAFFAGMTLPLFTVALLRAGAGEGVIGRVYAANTLGAILGVLLVVHVAIPVLGLQLSVWLAALLDIALGVYLLRVLSASPARVAAAGLSLASLLVAAVAMVAGKPDPREAASGVFRTGRAVISDRAIVPFIRDGKTASVAIVASADGTALIATNGKPDAALAIEASTPPTPDEETMALAAVLPLALAKSLDAVGIIGWGSGLTTHTLLGSPAPRLVETVEIEPAMYEGARLFGERVSRGYEDPRSSVRFEDARTYFSTGNRQYDVVISEPSNPWVSGVASLFTTEFYEFIARHLKREGLLVQWIQSYELNDALFGTMVAALVDVFPHVDVYLSNRSDLIFVASQHPIRKDMQMAGRLDSPVLQAELERVRLGGTDELALRRIGSEAVLRTFVEVLGVPPHSDFYPTVSLQAPRSRFMNQRSDSLQQLVDNGMPVLDILDGRVPPGSNARIASSPFSRFTEAREIAVGMVEGLRTGTVPDGLQARSASHAATLAALLQASRSMGEGDVALKAWSDLLARTASNVVGLLPREDLESAFAGAQWAQAAAATEPLAAELLEVYSAAAQRSTAAMLANGEALLKHPEFGRLSMLAREQVLVITMLGAIGSGAPELVRQLDETHGGAIPLSPNLSFVRMFLLAWSQD